MLIRSGGGVLLLVFLTSPAPAQTADQARLVLTVGAGFVGGGNLWRVRNQPLHDVAKTDTLDIARQVRSSVGVMFAGAYFPGEHLGFTGEGFLLGLGTEDDCRLVSASGSGQNQEACASINTGSHSASSVGLSIGTTYRVMSRRPLSPYAHLGVGIVVAQRSTVRTVGQKTITAGPDSGQQSDVFVYDDPSPVKLTTYMGLGLGFTLAVAKGYQLRLEARDNYLGLDRVTGPFPQAGLSIGKPPTSVKAKHIFSLVLGFDVVLERRRGRRY